MAKNGPSPASPRCHSAGSTKRLPCCSTASLGEMQERVTDYVTHRTSAAAEHRTGVSDPSPRCDFALRKCRGFLKLSSGAGGWQSSQTQVWRGDYDYTYRLPTKSEGA